MKVRDILAFGDPGIIEAFHSIQGEGPSAGTPTFFLRLSGCDIGCKFCDTGYASKRISTSPQEVLDTDIPHFNQMCVLSGGEPLSEDRILENERKNPTNGLIQQIEYYFTDFEIESSGTTDPQNIDILLRDHVIISPKLPHQAKNTTLKYIPLWVKYCKAIKVVWDNAQETKDFVLDLCRLVHDRRKIYLMPEGKTAEEVTASSGSAIEMCKLHSLKFSPRIHIWVWGKKRGV